MYNMTWLKFINVFVLQLFFVRLTYCERGKYLGSLYGNYTMQKWYSLQYFIVPFTGWNSKFKYLGKVKFIKLFNV